MLRQRLRNLGGLAPGLGIVAPHHALQFREFTHHFGQQVAQTEFGGAPGGPRLSPAWPGQPGADLDQPLPPVGQCAELALIDDPFQGRDMVREAVFQIAFPKERGVLKPGGDDPFIALFDRFRGRAVDIRHADKTGQQAAIGGGDREIFLLPLHNRDQHLLRQLEKVRLEFADKGRGPFNQRGDLIKQGRVEQGLAPPLPGEACGPGLDQGPAALEIGHHPACLCQGRGIVRRPFDANFSRVMETMSVAEGPGTHAQHGMFKRRLAKQDQRPSDRSRELGFMAAPAHASGDGQTLEGLLQHGREQGGRVLALDQRVADQPAALVRLERCQLIHANAAGRGKAQGGPAWPPRRVKGRPQGRAAAALGPIRLREGQPFDHKGQAARRGIPLALAGAKPLRGQITQAFIPEGHGEARERAWRQFFRADLDQQILGVRHGLLADGFNRGKSSASRLA